MLESSYQEFHFEKGSELTGPMPEELLSQNVYAELCQKVAHLDHTAHLRSWPWVVLALMEWNSQVPKCLFRAYLLLFCFVPSRVVIFENLGLGRNDNTLPTYLDKCSKVGVKVILHLVNTTRLSFVYESGNTLVWHSLSC